MDARIFVSHSSKDHKLAMTIATALERRGLACWISSRDIGAGQNFQEAIVEAIRTARAMVLVFSRNANDSAEIKKELALASEYRIIVIPVRAEEIVPTGAFKYELATRQWVDLFENWEQAIERLCEQINRISAPGSAPVTAQSKPAAGRRPGRLAVALLAGAGALVVVGVAVFVLRPGSSGSPPQTAASPPTAPAAGPEPAALHLRATPAALTRDDIVAALVKLDLYDAKRNPAGKGVKHQYAPQVIGSAVVIGDRATALMWQKGGSDHAMIRADSTAHIDQLNAAKYAGFGDWRLPTLEEAMSLMEPQAFDKCHIDLTFQRPPFFIWTADQASGGKGGIVIYYCDGALAGEADTFNASIRAVRAF
jgi:hypothetical protein